MPTKKQRRRRQKDRRHEYEYVYVDDEGHEVDVDPSELEAKPARPAAKTSAAAKPAAKSGSAARRPARVPQEPSWSRSARRALPWQGMMLLLVLVLFRSQPVATRILFGLIYAVAFIPFTYWVEKLTWQRYQKSQAAKAGGRAKKPARKP